MIEFKILKKSKRSFARLGLLKTPHGEVLTPTLVPVATQGTVKTLDSKEVEETKTQILICNTFHLHLRGVDKIVEKAGGLHSFLNWQKPLMTDSGGFQVFSLGFGKDLKVGKILKTFPGENKNKKISKNSQPREIKITPEGVIFRSLINGKELFIGPKESIRIQEKLGADIIFAFDECTPPLVNFEYAKMSLLRTNYWAKICLKTKRTSQALFGIIQGSHFKKLRVLAANFINSLDFDGFGIGGDLGKSKRTMLKILSWTIPLLEERKPRHLLGIGHLNDVEEIVKMGIDLFDCNFPTRYGRHGIALSEKGKIDLRKKKFLKNFEPVDKNCPCFVCQNYKKSYICHLFRAKESLAQKLISFHNLYFFNSFLEKIREKIKSSKI